MPISGSAAGRGRATERDRIVRRSPIPAPRQWCGDGKPPHASREQAVRHGEIRRLAHGIRSGRHALAANRAQLQAIVYQIAPEWTERRGIGAVTAAQAIVSFSHLDDAAEATAAFAALSGTSPCRPVAARWSGIGSTAAGPEP